MSLIAEMDSIMEFWLLVRALRMVKTTIESRTHGLLLGEIRDILIWQLVEEESSVRRP